jgi:hypothetical protein
MNNHITRKGACYAPTIFTAGIALAMAFNNPSEQEG